jgi:MFS family permease
VRDANEPIRVVRRHAGDDPNTRETLMSATEQSTEKTTATPVTSEERAAAKAGLRGGIFGYFLDQYDIYLPIITLAPALAYFEGADMDPAATATIAALVFVSTLIARPIGSMVFGYFGDRIGRRRPTIVAIIGFGVCTTLIACLPGHAQIGFASVVLLIVLRFVSGIFLGGEYSTAVPLAMEWSARRRRGLASGLITATSPLANAVIATFTLTLLSLLASDGIDSPYVQWGWRIPFLVGGALTIALLVYYVRNVREPHTPAAAEERTVSPLIQLFVGQHRKALLQVFVMMTGVWLLTQVAAAILPSTLANVVGLPAKTVSIIMLTASVVTVGGFLATALLSQRIGRRRLFIGFGLLSAVVASIAFALLVASPADDLARVVVLAVVVDVMTISVFGPIAAYLTERFPGSVRSAGYGIGYSFALIIPSFYTFYLGGLSHLIPAAFAPIVLIVVGGTLVVVGAVAGPETKDVEMGRTDAGA